MCRQNRVLSGALLGIGVTGQSKNELVVLNL